MYEPLLQAATILGATAMISGAGLRAWRGWLEIRRLELAQRGHVAPNSEQAVGLRIELAAVKERLKKLEAIASGVEL